MNMMGALLTASELNREILQTNGGCPRQDSKQVPPYLRHKSYFPANLLGF